MRAKIASHITISAKLLVGVAVLSRPTPPTTAKPPRRVVLARGYLQVGIGDPKLSILFCLENAVRADADRRPFRIPPATIVILAGTAIRTTVRIPSFNACLPMPPPRRAGEERAKIMAARR